MKGVIREQIFTPKGIPLTRLLDDDGGHPGQDCFIHLNMISLHIDKTPYMCVVDIT